MQNKNSNLLDKTPADYLKKSGKSLACSVITLVLFGYTGAKWLFTKRPNFAWMAITLCGVLWHIVHDAEVKIQRDSYSKENAILMDSISRLNMEPVDYLTLSNNPAQAIKPMFKDTVK